jgi:4-hydroxy-3-polyprenylbenzoate decarboxylase
VRVLVGITGASGAAFAIDFLKRCPGERFLIVSDWGRAVLRDELGLTPADLAPWVTRTFADGDLAAPFSSGTIRLDAFVIVPCSVSTMAKIAAGIADTLITRAAAVTLKERMRLVLALRETPLSTGMLENALRVSREGGIIAPIMPPFYHQPQTLDEAVAGFTAKLLALCGVDAGPGWHEDRLQSGDLAARPAAADPERGAK